ncbi:hypothetical protein OROMI_009539 [Orobanche minor]
MTKKFFHTIWVPDVEGSNEDRCELTRTPYGRQFIDKGLNSYLEVLFKIIVERGPSVGLNVSLSRYDLFHGHLFLAKESGRLGILFHAKEYHAYDKEIFPYNMGYCQVGKLIEGTLLLTIISPRSNVAYDNSMNLRNILWDCQVILQKHGWHQEDWDGICGHVFGALACVGLLVSLKVTAYCLLTEHEDVEDAVGSEEPTERDHGVDLQQPLLIKIVLR